MPLDLPDNAREVINRAKTDVQRDLPGSNPFLKNSVLGALVTGIASRIFDFYIQLQNTVDAIMPDTSVDEFLERWAAIFGKQREPATQSTGTVIAAGVAGSPVPLGTVMINSSGLTYVSTAATTITNQVFPIFSLTRVGTTVTATTIDPHGLSSNVPTTVAGAVEIEYNIVDALIQVLSPTVFTYQIAGSPSSPATGTFQGSFSGASVLIESVDFQDSEDGINVNLAPDEQLSLQSPLVGVNNTLGVDADGVEGGFDQESNDQLRSRTLFRIQNPVAHFNVTDIQEKAKEVVGVTRVFVQEITPGIGQVTIYFMRDNDPDPIPTPLEVDDVKNKLLEIKPANTGVDDMIVSAPVGVPTDFDFASLTPDTPTMRTAIDNSLLQFFAEETSVGESITQDSYRSAIKNTIDPETGDIVQDFTLTTPIGDIIITNNQIGLLGTVTYP